MTDSAHYKDTLASEQLISGIKVLDLSRILAGPLAAMMLGDLGADVIKVERPGSGDDTRGWGPPFDGRGESAYYLSVNRNKRSIALDLRHPTERAILLDLISEADVVVENFRPAALRRLALDPGELLHRFPALVWCTIRGFDRGDGRPGYDFLIQAERGWMAITGEADGPPMKMGVALADIVAGKDAAIAILAALLAKARSGRGRRVTVSLSRSATGALVNVAQNVLVSGEEARRWGNAHPNLVPYQLFHASDRPFVIAVGSDTQWRACATALGLEAMAGDPRFLANEGRVVHRAVLIAVMSERLAQRQAADWIEVLDAAGVPCGVVKSVAESLEDVDASALTGLPPSVPGSVRLPPPRLDEHGAEIRRLGWRCFDAGKVTSEGR